jgi:stage II sporulation protein P
MGTPGYRTEDASYNMIRVGAEIKNILEENGIGVIHDTTLHDEPSYNNSYIYARETIEERLAEYPSIRMVLDVHRDAIYDGDGNPYKVISATEEGSAAQLSLVIGTNGSGLTHDNWQENLKLAAAVQNTLLAKHPTLMRPIVVRNSRYNQHCTTGSLLVEVGAAGNSLDEALLAARLFAKGFAETIL